MTPFSGTRCESALSLDLEIPFLIHVYWMSTLIVRCQVGYEDVAADAAVVYDFVSRS